MGVVYMGYAFHLIMKPSPADVMASLCQLPRRNQNRTAADSARCISPTVNAIHYLRPPQLLTIPFQVVLFYTSLDDTHSVTYGYVGNQYHFDPINV
jgi:hypothetical protein